MDKEKIVFLPIISSLLVMIALISGSYSIIGFPLLFYWYIYIYFIKDKDEGRIFNFVFIFNFLIMILIYYYYIKIYGIPYFGNGSDDLAYETNAMEVYKNLNVFQFNKIDSLIFGYKENNIFYIYFISLMIRFSQFIFGSYSTIVPRIINSIFVGVSSVYFYRILIHENIFNNRHVKKLYVILFGCFPLISYISAHVYRDTLIMLIFISTFYYTNFSKVTSRFKKYFLISINILILYYLRPVLAIMLFFLVLLNLRKNFMIRNKKIIIIGSIMLVVAIISGVNILNYRKYLELYSQTYALDNSGLSVHVFNAKGPIGYLLRLIYLLIIPFPIFNLNMIENFVKVSSLFKIFCLPMVIKGISLNYKENRLYSVMYLLVLYTSIAFTTVNPRQSIVMIPFFLLQAAKGYEYTINNHKRDYMLISFLLIIALYVTYFIAKFAI